jgi:LmbE family N-acetylglucosaminyl deacetylase
MVDDPVDARSAAALMRGWGVPADGELDRIVIVSPHLDDAVLGTARLLAAHPGATVITVFTGKPPRYPTPMRTWDVQSGFGPDDDVMAARRAEDVAALGVLDATPVWLDFVEYSYRPGDKPVSARAIAPVLADAIVAADPTVVVAPFGLANPDHDVTHRACMLAREDPRLLDRSWWCYEDSGYKHIPGMLAMRISRLFNRGLWPTPIAPPIDPTEERKQKAVQCYPSQLLALEDDWQISVKLAAPAPEQYWRLAPPPAGWENLAGS